MSEYRIKIELSGNTLEGKVNEAVAAAKVLRLTATKPDGSKLTLQPSDWQFSRTLPGTLHVDDNGEIKGNFGNTAFPAGRKMQVWLALSFERYSDLGLQDVVPEFPQPEPLLRSIRPAKRQFSEKLSFIIKISRDPTDGTTNEIVGGRWEDYNHLNIREAGSTQNIANVWSMTGLSMAYNVLGLSGSMEMTGIRLDTTVQTIRASITANAFSISTSNIGWRRTYSSTHASHSVSTTGTDFQINQVSGNRFIMVDPPVLDVEFAVMDPINEDEVFWSGSVKACAGRAAWGGGRWIQLRQADLDPNVWAALNTSQEFLDNWALMSDLQPHIRELNATIPGQPAHFSPLADEPTPLSDAIPLNGSARLVIRSGFSQLFHMHSGWGRSFYFSPSTSYYLTTIRQYYDELDQTVGRYNVLVNGAAYFHYRCRQKNEGAAFAGWGNDPSATIVSAYEGAVAHRVVTVRDRNAMPAVQAELMMAKRSDAQDDGLVQISAARFLVRDSATDGNHGSLTISRQDNRIELRNQRGTVNLDANAIEISGESVRMGRQGGMMAMNPQGGTVDVTCAQVFRVNGQRVELAP